MDKEDLDKAFPPLPRDHVLSMSEGFLGPFSEMPLLTNNSKGGLASGLYWKEVLCQVSVVQPQNFL